MLFFQSIFQVAESLMTVSNEAYFKMGQLENAIGWFEKAIALDPKRAVAYGNLGDACLKLNRKAEAKKAFQKCLELAPNSKDASTIAAKPADI
jgi:tetratricopeptide (TPR) repeat protein